MTSRHRAAGRPRTLLYVVSVSGLLTALPTLAQEAQREDDRDGRGTRLAPVLVEGIGFGNAAEEANLAADIDREQIETFRPATAKDLFRGESAVTVSGSVTANQKVYVRGIEETNLATSIDGARQNNKLFHHNATTIIDPRLLKSARVDAGVAPADAGPGALAGSIAYETVDVSDLLAPGRDLGGYVETGYETNGDTWSTLGSAYGRQNGFEGLLFLNNADGDDYEDGDGDEVRGSAAELTSGLGKVAYEAETGDRIELSYERVTDEGVRPYRANIGNIIGGRPVPETRIYDLERENVILSYENTRADGLWDPQVTLAFSGTDLQTTEEALATGDTIEYRADSRSYNATLANEMHFDGGSVNVGVDGYTERAKFFSDFYNSEEEADNVGLFAQARMNASSRLALSFGGRIDHQDFTGTGGQEQDNTGISGNASAEFALTDWLALEAGASSSFGGIELAETYIQNPDWDYDDIDPVRGKNRFAGFTVRQSNVTFSAQAFRTDIENGRTPSFGDGPALTRDFQSEGYDLSLGYDWTSGYVRAAFSSVDTQIDGGAADSFLGNYFTVPLGETASLTAVQRIDALGVTVGGTAEFAFDEDSPASGGAGSTDAIQEIDGYEVFNLFVEYVPRRFENLSLRASVDNVFDEAYANRGNYGQEFATVEPLQDPGRSFGLSARLTY